jgi:hypothetical protein
MPESWEEARAKCQAALGQLVEGNAEAFKSLWSRSDDIVIMGVRRLRARVGAGS